MSDPVEVQYAGRVGPHRESHEPRLLGLDFVGAGISPVSGYIKWSKVQPIGGKWGMAFNADLGCCGFSAWQHNNAAKAAAAPTGTVEAWQHVNATTWSPHYPRLDLAYFAYGIAQGEPGPRPDQGVSNASMLAWAYKLGLIDGYLEVPIEYADWFGMTFNGIIIGQVLDGKQATSDFNAVPKRIWKAMGKSDGHDTLGIAGDGAGGGDEITWGGVQPYDVTYRETNWTDCWVIIDKDDPNVDQVALKAVLTQLHGVVKIDAPRSALGPANEASGVSVPDNSVGDAEQGLLRACEDALKDLSSFVTDEAKKSPELEREVKRLVAKALSQAIPAIIARVLEQLAIEVLPKAL